MCIRLTTTLAVGAALSAVVACSNDPLWGSEVSDAAQTPAPAARETDTETQWGMVAFPYDFTGAAWNKTHELVNDNGTLSVVQLDDGIPWAEALSGKAYPKKVQDKWGDLRNRLVKTRPVFLTIAPLQDDRETLHRPSEGSSMPSQMKDAPLNHRDIKKAYLAYVLKAVEKFNPTYLNIGQEAGEIAFRKPERWAAFAELIDHVREGVKAKHPEVQIGISFGLQSLMEPAVAERVKPFVDRCDYLGVSFYPFMSDFHERFGTKALATGTTEWRGALNWLANYSDKPLAMCETAYSSTDVQVPAYDLDMKGSTDLQQQYLIDLAHAAKRDAYLFGVWFLPVDYDKLADKLPNGDGSLDIWEHAGFFDKNLNAKPVWSTWQSIVAGEELPYTDYAEVGLPVLVDLGFHEKGDLFQVPDPSKTTLDTADVPAGADAAMFWQFSTPTSGQKWNWSIRTLAKGELDGLAELRFTAKSTRKLPMVVQLKEAGGESFFASVQLETDWTKVRLTVADFQVDAKTKQNGKLDTDAISEMLFVVVREEKTVTTFFKGEVRIAELTAH